MGQKSQPGVALLSGFSAGMLKSFLAGRVDELTPAAQLRALLAQPEYAAVRSRATADAEAAGAADAEALGAAA